ncbi:MAG: FAD binding domain-containing protein, partial [Candidatus Adiutrix sp.]
MFDIQEFYQASSVTEAVELLATHPKARLICGGTDVLVRLRHFDERFKVLVSIKEVPELKALCCDDEGQFLTLGAGLTFSEIMKSELVQKYLPVLAESCATVAGPQIRNMGTIGGNVANGATSADLAAPLLILEPEVLICGPNGQRRTPLNGLFTGPGAVALGLAEVITSFVFPLSPLKSLKACYYKYAMRSAMDIATIGCAVGLSMADDEISELRLAMAVAAPTPIRCPQAEKS